MDTSQVADLARPLAEAAGLELYDVERRGNVLLVSLAAGPSGQLDVDGLESVSRSLSIALDEHDDGDGAYVLEVSSPGVERNLRTERHFEGAIGEIVTITTVPGPDGRRRLRGELLTADGGAVSVADAEAGTVIVSIDEVEKARTIFEWGPAPKPGKGQKNQSGKGKKASTAGAGKNSATKHSSTKDSEASS